MENCLLLDPLSETFRNYSEMNGLMMCLSTKIKTNFFLDVMPLDDLITELNADDQDAVFTPSHQSFRVFPQFINCCPISGCVDDSHRYSLVLFTSEPKGAALSSNHRCCSTFFSLAPFFPHICDLIKKYSRSTFTLN